MIRSGLALALVLAAAPATALAAPDLGPALARAKAEDWRGAQALLERQTRWGCPAPALYLLGLARAKTGDVRGALDAETRALGCSPALEAAYREGAVALVRWAGGQLATTGFRFETTMSSQNGPASAGPPAPRAVETIIADADRQIPGLAAEYRAALAASPCPSRTANPPADAQKCMALLEAPVPPPPDVALP